MTPRLKQIQERVEKATEEPWEDVVLTSGFYDYWWIQGPSYIAPKSDEYGNCPEHLTSYDATFISHARSDVPYLLQFIESQAKEIEALRKANAYQSETISWFDAIEDADAVAKAREEME